MSYSFLQLEKYPINLCRVVIGSTKRSELHILTNYPPRRLCPTILQSLPLGNAKWWQLCIFKRFRIIRNSSEHPLPCLFGGCKMMTITHFDMFSDNRIISIDYTCFTTCPRLSVVVTVVSIVCDLSSCVVAWIVKFEDHRQTDKETDSQSEKKTSRQTDNQTERQTSRQLDKQTDRYSDM